MMGSRLPPQLKGRPCTGTDVIIRLVTGGDLEKRARARALFKQCEAGKTTLLAPVTMIADCVSVLSSPRLYNLARAEVVGLLLPLLCPSHFRLVHEQTLLRALDLYLGTGVELWRCLHPGHRVTGRFAGAPFYQPGI